MINFKVRFKNPVFLFQLALSFFVPILGYYGLTEHDLTTWNSVFNLLGNAFSNPYVILTVIISLWHTINDPTTKGLSDSKQAQSYTEPK